MHSEAPCQRQPAASPLGRPRNRFRSRSLAAAAAGITSGAGAQSASATIIADLMVNASPADGSFTVDGTINGEVDLLAAVMMGNWTLGLDPTPGGMMNPGSTVELYATPPAMGMADDLVLMTPGQTVDATLAWANDGLLVRNGTPNPGWVAGDLGYAGFRFDDGGTTVYGWLQIELANGLDDYTILQWAYDDSGAPITVGAIPEPSTALLVGLGLAALSSRLCRRPRSPRDDRAT